MRLLQIPLVRRLLAGAALGIAAAVAADCPPPPPSAAELQVRLRAVQPSDRGFLWRLDKDGRSSWLYGTLHVNRLAWSAPGPRVRQALAASSVLALELDPADPDLGRLLLAANDPVRNRRVLAGSEALRDRLAASACLPVAGLERLPAMLQLTTLAMAQARHDGLHAELGVDLVLLGAAQASGKRLVALETPARQIEALTGLPEDDERELVADGLREMTTGASRAVVERLVHAWAEGDEPALADYPQWCQCEDTPAERRFTRRVNDDRNPALADRLVALHDGGDSVFAGIGALHMVGPQALPRLLRERGFTVRRVPFTPAPGPGGTGAQRG